MDYETISTEDFGRTLKGLGLNLIVRDVKRSAKFLVDVFGMEAHRLSEDFAIMRYGDQIFQLHSDGTYGSHPLLGLLPENPPRGAGVEIRLYESNPEDACARAERAGGTILHGPEEKPHGLVEALILDPDGYVWGPSRPI